MCKYILNNNNLIFNRREEAEEYAEKQGLKKFTITGVTVTWEYEITDNYKYRMSSTGFSSKKYGKCEVCGQHVSEVFLQVEQRKYFDTINNKKSYTHHGCKDYFGHKDCLIKQRRS